MRRVLLMAAIVCLATFSAKAQDPVKVAPKHYKVEFENEQVRVLRVHLGPKESIPMHEHPPSVLTFLTNGHFKSTPADGKTTEGTAMAGSVRYRPAIRHAVENLNDRDLELIEVELKANPAAAKPPAAKKKR